MFLIRPSVLIIIRGLHFVQSQDEVRKEEEEEDETHGGGDTAEGYLSYRTVHFEVEQRFRNQFTMYSSGKQVKVMEDQIYFVPPPVTIQLLMVNYRTGQTGTETETALLGETVSVRLTH